MFDTHSTFDSLSLFELESDVTKLVSGFPSIETHPFNLIGFAQMRLGKVDVTRSNENIFYLCNVSFVFSI